MSITKILGSTSPKEKAVFEAVIDLLEEGAAADSMKVSDIARKAGIGKGTVYEYFASKEEIVGKALIYDMENTIEEIENRVQAEKGFWARVRTIFDWIEEKYRNQSSFFRILQFGRANAGIPQPIRQILGTQKDCMYDVHEGFRVMIQDGIDEGVVSPGIPVPYMISAVTANLLSYCFYLSQPEELGNTDYQGMKEFVLSCIRKSLSDE